MKPMFRIQKVQSSAERSRYELQRRAYAQGIKLWLIPWRYKYWEIVSYHDTLALAERHMALICEYPKILEEHEYDAKGQLITYCWM